MRHFDASLCGLGGCPLAPGATGNIVTEDVVFLAESLGFNTGIDLEEAGRGAQDRAGGAAERGAVRADRQGRPAEGLRVRGRPQARRCMNIESPIKGGTPVSFALGEDYPELREPVRRICAKYPGAYWRELEDALRLSDRVRQRPDRGRLSSRR